MHAYTSRRKYTKCQDAKPNALSYVRDIEYKVLLPKTPIFIVALLDQRAFSCLAGHQKKTMYTISLLIDYVHKDI